MENSIVACRQRQASVSVCFPAHLFLFEVRNYSRIDFLNLLFSVAFSLGSP